jgi:uroporphyrinogen-III synthase
MSAVKTPDAHDRLYKVGSILVSQPKPDDKSPYFELVRKYNLKVDFRPFIQIEPVVLKDFRKQKINILEHTAVIFTSRNAVDHFFRICAESKLECLLK